MKQLEIIEPLKEILAANSQIQTAFLYGSVARKMATANSDVDIATVITSDFDVDDLIKLIEAHFQNHLVRVGNVVLRNKIVLYFNSLPKVEISFATSIEEHARNYLGSEISLENIESSILFDHTGNALHYFQQITNNKMAIKPEEKENLIDKFLYEFESCSNAHRRSDGYQFYFFYNIALHVAIQLNHLAKGEIKFNFLPKNFIANTLTKEEQDIFYEVKGSLFLPEANKQKRKLLDFFYNSIKTLISQEKLEEIKTFCEWIYKRDFIWNFRDIGKHNSKIKEGLIFRTATMTLFQNETFFESFLNKKNIQTVIDLRAEREIKDLAYSENSISKFNYIIAPFDPWNQSIEFQATHHQGSNIEIAYRFFGLECKPSIKTVMETILEQENAVAIHCHAGKDRTGIIISMLHMLSGADLNTIYTDYLATEMDTKKEYLDIVLNIINEKGGIENYLIDCGLNKTQVQHLKMKITNGN